MLQTNSKKLILQHQEQELEKPRIIGDYQLSKFLIDVKVKTLGVGTFGLVKLAIH